MSSSGTHIIRQQHLDVEMIGSEPEGFKLQRMLTEFCNDRLLHAIEEVLDRSVPPDVYLYLERVDVEAGTVKKEQMEEVLIESVARAVEKVVQGTIAQPADHRANTKQDSSKVSYGLKAIGVFEYFLVNGRLPWNFRLPIGKTLEEFVREVFDTEGWRGSREAELKNILNVSSSRHRLTEQFSESFLSALLGKLVIGFPPVVQHVVSELNLEGSPPISQSMKKRIWEVAFALVSEVEGEMNEKALAKAALGSAQGFPTRIVAKLQELAGPEAPSLPSPANAVVTDKSIIGHKSVESSRSEPAPLGQRDQPSPENSSSMFHRSLDQNEIYVENAGLVLLHPFLPMLFEALDVARGNTITQLDRALNLMYFLATGQEHAPEHELVLPKVLCSIAPETPVEGGIELAQAEIEEASGLLEAVIRHWESLRGTTVDGLRGSFLLRLGKLSLREDGDWLLQIEPKSYDVLLDSLPWSISMVKLPWMNRMLRVDWSNHE